jgi:hypothetical protein
VRGAEIAARSSWTAAARRAVYNPFARSPYENSRSPRGMTNKEITDEIYLSHRPVGGHLYQAFPKLRNTGRKQLRDALSEPRQQRSTK